MVNVLVFAGVVVLSVMLYFFILFYTKANRLFDFVRVVVGSCRRCRGGGVDSYIGVCVNKGKRSAPKRDRTTDLSLTKRVLYH